MSAAGNSLDGTEDAEGTEAPETSRGLTRWALLRCSSSPVQMRFEYTSRACGLRSPKRPGLARELTLAVLVWKNDVHPLLVVDRTGVAIGGEARNSWGCE